MNVKEEERSKKMCFSEKKRSKKVSIKEEKRSKKMCFPGKKCSKKSEY